jgi:TolA-binding protein
MRLGALYEARGAEEAAVGEYGRAAEGAEGGGEKAEALLARGLVHYRGGAFLPALEDFRAVCEEHGETAAAAQAQFMRGWCLYLLGKDEEALAACRGFLKEHAESEFAPDVRFWLGEYAFNHGDWEGAEKAFRELADLHPESAAAPEALYWAGRSAAAAREYLRANGHLNALIAGWPEHPRLAEALLAQGDVLGELGQFPAAILAFDEVLTKFPRGAAAMAAWGRKGDCLYTLGQDEPSRYEEALLCYRALRDFPDAPEDLSLQASYKIGRCLEKTGHAAEAVEQYMQTAYDYLGRTAPSAESGVWFTRSAFGAGALLERAGRWREAAGVYCRVAESGAPAAVEAAERVRRIEEEHGGARE